MFGGVRSIGLAVRPRTDATVIRLIGGLLPGDGAILAMFKRYRDVGCSIHELVAATSAATLPGNETQAALADRQRDGILMAKMRFAGARFRVQNLTLSIFSAGRSKGCVRNQ